MNTPQIVMPNFRTLLLNIVSDQQPIGHFEF
jgi:hypothetical protein